MFYFLPLLVDIQLLAIFHKPEHINVVLLNICAGSHKFLELILCYNFRILLKVGTFFDIVFQINMLVYVLFR